MPTRSANASWSGGLKDGHGQLTSQSGTVHSNYSFPSRFEEQDGTNPEELLAAAHAGCFAMALSALLGEDGYAPANIDADAGVTLAEVDGKPTITTVELTVRAQVPDIDQGAFDRIVKQTEDFCPVSRALSGCTISVQAKLTG